MKKEKVPVVSLILLSIVLCGFICFVEIVLAQQPVKDVSINITLQEISNNANYSKFIKITNLNDEQGINDNLSLLVEINLSHNSDFVFWNVSKIINSYSESGFGTLIIDEGDYVICTRFLELNFVDPVSENNFACRELTTNINNSYNYNFSDINISDLNESFLNESYFNISDVNYSDDENVSENSSEELEFCDCSLKLITEKQLFYEGEKLIFNIEDCFDDSKFNNYVEYWIESSEGIVKQKLNTTSKASKSYTPSFDGREKYFLIKAKFAECSNTSEKLVVYTQIMEEKETYLELIVPEEEYSDVVFVSIKGYKGDTGKNLISLWVEKSGKKYSQTTKIYIEQKNEEFNLKLPILLKIEESGEYVLVAEGLDEREEKELRIIREKTIGEEKEDILTTEETVFEEKTKINSFYTLKKIFSENITVYVTVQNPDDELLKIIGEYEEKIVYPVGEKNVVTLSITSANETLIAELLSGDKLIDSKVVHLNLTIKNASKSEKKETEIIELNNFEDTTVDKNSNLSNYQAEINKSYGNEITGNFAVISTPKLKKQSVFFILVSVVLSFVIFHKKTRNFILKKTKFFK